MGFEYLDAEMADAIEIELALEPPLDFRHQHTYAPLNRFDWSNA